MKFEELTDWIEYNVLTNRMEKVQARVVHGVLQAKDVNGVYHNWDLPHNYLKDLDFEETRFNPNEYEPKNMKYIILLTLIALTWFLLIVGGELF